MAKKNKYKALFEFEEVFLQRSPDSQSFEHLDMVLQPGIVLVTHLLRTEIRAIRSRYHVAYIVLQL